MKKADILFFQPVFLTQEVCFKNGGGEGDGGSSGNSDGGADDKPVPDRPEEGRKG